jgi:hypothetical protein
MYYHRLQLKLPYEECKKVYDKRDVRHEPLTGQRFNFTIGMSQRDVVYQMGEPLERRKSDRWFCDEEWVYKVCIIYFGHGILKDLRFRDAPDEPKPIYRWSGREMPL